MQNFRRLKVWQLAHALALELTRAFSPRVCARIPGFRSQTLRAATSIPWNIAEGCGRVSPQEFHRFLETALSSLTELESQLLFARDARLIRAPLDLRLEQRATTLRRMLISFMKTVLPPDSTSS